MSGLDDPKNAPVSRGKIGRFVTLCINIFSGFLG
nr:MAG TPA: hypothetical protein [Caudoviricetes sp.]